MTVILKSKEGEDVQVNWWIVWSVLCQVWTAELFLSASCVSTHRSARAQARRTLSEAYAQLA
jgi:hypothetical protein